MNQRKISVCYYSLVNQSEVTPVINDLLVKSYEWSDIKKLPKLMYNHSLIIKKAIIRLQEDMEKKNIASNIMNETFTMMELQMLYESVFQRQFTRNNFQRKMLSLNILERLSKQYNGKAHKAPYTYKFKEST